MGKEHRVPAKRFLEMMERVRDGDGDGDGDGLRGPTMSSQQQQQERTRPLVVDVREEAEFALGAKVRGSINVPISKILRHSSQKAAAAASGGKSVGGAMAEGGDTGDLEHLLLGEQDEDDEGACLRAVLGRSISSVRGETIRRLLRGSFWTMLVPAAVTVLGGKGGGLVMLRAGLSRWKSWPNEIHNYEHIDEYKTHRTL